MLKLRTTICEQLFLAIFILMLEGCGRTGVTSLTMPQDQSIPQARNGSPSSDRFAMIESPTLAQAASTYPIDVLAQKPLAYYQLNDASSTLIDSGPYAIAGTYGTNVTRGAQTITSFASSASGFPGGTSYNASGFAYTPESTRLQSPTISIEAWIRVNAPTAPNMVVPVVIYGQSDSYALFLEGKSDGTESIQYAQRNVGQSNTLIVHGTLPLSAGSVYHLVVTFDGTTVTTYVNGFIDQVATFPGTIAYASKSVSGLQIGGETSHWTPFSGTIAQVAVYAQPLTQQTIIQHYLAGQPLALVSEQAKSSDSFVDSIAVNTHFSSNHTVYFTAFPQAAKLLIASGIRHIRDNVNFGAAFVSQVKQLAAANIHGDFITNSKLTAQQLQSYPALVSPSLESFEAPNEPDDAGNPNWETDCVAFQKQLYSWLKASPLTVKYPVLGPGLAWPPGFEVLGNLTAYMDIGNLHDYMALYNPGFVGGPWYGMKVMLNDERASSGTEPVMSTEAGYSTTPGSQGNPALDNPTDLRYITRLFFEQFNAGITRTYSYEFLDTGLGGFGTYGIVNSSLTPKPSYYGLQAIISALADPGPSFAPASLPLSISGLGNIHHLLMQKRNGTFVLALWIEAPSWDVVNNVRLAVPNQNITLSVGRTFSNSTFATMNDFGSFSTRALSWKGQQTSISVSDMITLVTLTP